MSEKLTPGFTELNRPSPHIKVADEVLRGEQLQQEFELINRNVQNYTPEYTDRLYQGLVNEGQARQTAAREARTDELTGLLNRRGLLERLDGLMNNPDFNASEHTLAFIDLNGFKHVNDTYGHAEGDKVLMEVGKRLRLRREGDIVARLGGDELVVVSKKRTDADPKLAEEKFLDYLSFAVGQGGVNAGYKNIRASIGLSDMNEFPTPAAIIHEADMRMRANKQASGAGR